MKIFYCVRSLAHIPSCMYNIKMLADMQYQVIPVVGQSTPALDQVMQESGLNYFAKSVKLSSNRFVERLQLNANYRRNLRLALQRFMPGDLIIFGTADSAIYAGQKYRNNKYAICLKEMHEQDRFYAFTLKKIVRQASAVICCEKNRARYAQFIWKLAKRPFVLSNKPYGYSSEPQMRPSCQQTSEIVRQIQGKQAIVYQARHIHFASELIALAKALKEINDGLLLVLIGNVDHARDLEKIVEIYPEVLSTGHIPAPKHLEITSYAKVGVALYAENSLNNMFCAPNKIYEYAGFGIPSLCNDVPGLVETIGLHKAGVCVDWTDVQSIRNGLLQILQQYDYYARNALEFYKSENNQAVLDDIVKSIACIKE